VARFVPNPNFEREFSAHLRPLLRQVEQGIEEVARTHAGRPVPEVLSALESVVSRAGIASGADLPEIAQRISDQKPGA